MFKRTKKLVGKGVEKAQTGISRGLGASILLDAGKFMNETVKGFLKGSQIEQKESFEQAIRRMKLSEEDLQKRQKQFFIQFVVFLLLGFCTFSYGIYMFLEAAWGSGIVVVLLTAVLMVYALRAHFWMFQIKNRKLGCTVKEWMNNKVEETDKNIVPK